jgi:GGDEF domain-containing protein
VSGLHRLRYTDTRRLAVFGGTLLLAGITALAWARGVDPAESVGAALYVPVFLAASLLGPGEGVGIGLLASIGYVVLRIPAIRVVGFSKLSGVLIPRVGSYLLFGAVIGYAARRLNASLSHLERHDMVDDATRLHNARWFLEATDAEMNRVQRALDPERGFLGYGSVFSVVVAGVGEEAFQGREGARLLSEVGDAMTKGLRRSDRPVHAHDTSHRFVLLLPGTASAGAHIVEDRTVERLRDLLGDRAVGLTSISITYPDDAEALVDLREQFERIDAAERLPV